MSPWRGDASALSDRIAAFVTASLEGRATEGFEGLALAIAAWQRAHDPVARALSPVAPASMADIPAVPVALFKELPVGTIGADEPCVTFRTSGTTGGGRGQHRMRSTALYDLGALGGAQAFLMDFPRDVVALLDDPARTPDSSLSHMVGLFSEHATWHLRDGRLDAVTATDRIRGSGPFFVATTAFALAEWLEGEVPALPAGSVLMVTGGFKGRVHRLDGDVLYREAMDRLRPARTVTEYGMTELSSQLWGTPDTPYRPPPWLRALAVDPTSGAPLAPGRDGQLRFYDLCNLDTAIGIETMDHGVVHPDGQVTLHGRLAGAPARGCSLTVEEAWQKRGSE